MTRVHLLALAASFATATSAYSMVHTNIAPAQQRKIVVFDLHDVVLKDKYSIAYKAFLTHVHWARYNYNLIKSLIIFGYNKKIKTTDPKKLSVEYAILNGVTDPLYKQYVLTILNPHVIHEQAAEYVQQLGNQGFLRFAFSNLGEDSLAHLQKSINLEQLFDGKYICNAQDNYVTKASPEAFKNLLTKVIIPTYQQRYGAGAFPEEIIVVDDSLKKLKTMEQGFAELQQEMPALQSIKLVPVQFKNSAQMQTIVKAELSK